MEDESHGGTEEYPDGLRERGAEEHRQHHPHDRRMDAARPQRALVHLPHHAERVRQLPLHQDRTRHQHRTRPLLGQPPLHVEQLRQHNSGDTAYRTGIRLPLHQTESD
jgi:hypothetical protein